MNEIPPSKGITGNITFQNVTSIGYYAFYNCYDLTSVTIGSGIQGISEGAFNTNANPITLTIGKTVAEVGGMVYAQWNLPSGSTIVCTDNTITI